MTGRISMLEATEASIFQGPNRRQRGDNLVTAYRFQSWKFDGILLANKNAQNSINPASEMIMKNTKFLPLLATVGLLVSASAFAQTVATDPVGFTSTTVTQNSVKALSLPFNKVPDYAAAISTVTTTTIQTTGAAFATNAFAPFASNPHLVRIVSGTAAGRQYRIASHTPDTLTLVAGSDLTGVAAGDRYQIFASETLASLFGAAPGAAINTNADPAIADNVLIRGSSSFITYYNDGTQWLRQGTGAVSNNAAITPEQGFLFVRRAGSDFTFTALGAVPTTNLRTDLPANTVTSFGNRFPVATNLVGLGLDTLPGWNKNADPSIADNVLTRGSSSWITYYYDPTSGGPTNGNPGSWVRQGTQAPNQNPAIAIGNSVLVVRHAGSSVTLNQSLPYTLP